MSSIEFKSENAKLVDKILEQGQKLRNAMVQSILQNDPLNPEIIYNKHFNTPACSDNNLENQIKSDSSLLSAFLKGDYLTKEEEKTALNNIKSMSISDACREKHFLSQCCCVTCNAYNTNNLKCDMRRQPVSQEDKCLSNCIDEKFINKDFVDIIKYVDSLKVFLHSIHLNILGNKKVSHDVSKKQSTFVLNETYFVEYVISEFFSEKLLKSKSKIDSGLESNHVRVCARRTSEVIYIKQTFLHDVCNLHKFSLDDHDITFNVKYKNRGQKTSELLGVAKFNLGLFALSKDLTCNKTLPIYLNEISPLVIGTLKVILQLGCGKIYFGQQFVDAILNKKKFSDDNSEELAEYEANFETTVLKDNLPFNKKIFRETESKEPTPLINVSQSQKLKPKSAHFTLNRNVKVFPDKNLEKLNKIQTINLEEETVPLLYEDDILLKLRENFMIIEFWEKNDQADQLFGLTRLPLHQFYLAYRNTIILQHIKKNKLPVIGTDWWEPIYSADSNDLIGQVQVLTALGTEEQIRNLEFERGFKDDVVKAKFPNFSNLQRNIKPSHSSYFGSRTKVVRKQLKRVQDKSVNTITPRDQKKTESASLEKLKPQKSDVGIQSNIEINMNDKKESDSVPRLNVMLDTFMKLLEQKPVRMENSTNTDPVVNSSTSTQYPQNVESGQPQVRKTSELLDSLQNALVMDSKPIKTLPKLSSFKVQISINAANKLPVRRKMKSKSKRSKVKSPKQEENILPTTYVTFETLPGEPLRITPVFPKSTSPQWNYRCEVGLPTDLITDPQKRLIFKVWKKSTNSVLQPNMLTDLVVGFAAVDLSVLAAGLPNIQGWFNIIDFSGKCNGQINVHVIPLENLTRSSDYSNISLNAPISNTNLSKPKSEAEDCDQLLSGVLKRKFTELDEITQRLRLRLSQVVTEDSSEGSNDDMADEFEKDINNICIEDDFDLIDFEEEAKKLNANLNCQKSDDRDNLECADLLSVLDEEAGTSQQTTEIKNDLIADSNNVRVDDKLKLNNAELSIGSSNSSQSSYMEKHIMKGKQRIDSLLEMLSLINVEVGQSFASRYVSGCSVTNETINAQDIFKDLDENSRPNINGSTSYDPLMLQQLYAGSTSGSSQNGGNLADDATNGISSRTDGSETSVITNFSDCRPNPDGQGTNSDDKGT